MMDENLFAMFMSLDDTPRVRERTHQTPIGWIGSKARSLDYILPHIPYRKGYVEPFGGSGSVLIARKPSPLEVYNDKFGGVTNFYRVIRDKSLYNKLIERLELTVHSRLEFEWCRDTWELTDDPVERAARWYYANENSFGKKGKAFARATGKMGQFGRALHKSLEGFPVIHQRFYNVQVECLDWRQILTDYDNPNTVFYLDPPYLGTYSGVYKFEMRKDEHAEMLERIFHLEGFVALSGYANPETLSLYDKYPWDSCQRWQIHSTMLAQAFTQENNLASKQDELKRSAATECLWIKEAK